ncbi:MAG: hypothetical protein OHK0022_06430 [Roseiflexaceae bacterium]
MSYTSATEGCAPAVSPEHLCLLNGQRWGLWRWTALRGAGFPSEQVLQIAEPELSNAADRLIQAEAEAQATSVAALAALNHMLDRLRADGLWEESSLREGLLRAARLLRKGRLPDQPTGDPSADAQIAALARAEEELLAAQSAFPQIYAAASQHCAETLYAVSRDERFREAVIWQNRSAFHSAVVRLHDPTGLAHRATQQRQHEELVANYLQRYCVKNDTIGFFGPVGWARITPGPELTLRPGPQLLAARRTYFEQWGIDALAAALAERYPLWPWCAPRRLPFVSLRDRTLCLPGRRPLVLSPLQAAVLRLCDGQHTAEVLAAELAAALPELVDDAETVFETLDHFQENGLIVWTLEVPFTTYPEQQLRLLLERIDEPELRDATLGELDRLEALRAAVAAAAGDSQRLDLALTELETSFSASTGAAATQNAGATYAARTLLYEDCRRDAEVTLGEQLVATLEAPLDLLLTSARWYTATIAERYRTAFGQIYADLCRESGLSTVDGSSFWSRVQQQLLGDRAGLINETTEAFQQRWAAVLELPEGQRAVAYRAGELRTRVDALFAVERRGWQTALYHSPDLMIAADSPEAVARGEYLLVMGELHMSSNTLRSSLFVEQHPAREELLLAVDRDIPATCVVPEPPRSWREVTARLNSRLGRPRDLRLVSSNDSCGVPPGQALLIADLVVVDSGAGLQARTRDGQRRFDLIECFSEVLGMEIVNQFKPLRHARHTPRISIDRLVIQRETWRFQPAELPFVFEKQDEARFLGLRRWQRAQQLPRWAFVKMPTERKPFYVDFDSPVLVQMLAKALRRACTAGAAEEWFSISEMLPDHRQLWLHDAEGRRYTSELRFVAVDQCE